MAVEVRIAVEKFLMRETPAHVRPEALCGEITFKVWWHGFEIVVTEPGTKRTTKRRSNLFEIERPI